MALKLVTAPPGTGKTLLLIKMIFEYLKDGRRVYANIDQLKIDEVLPIPHNADWRDLPDGSVVIYDEAQEHASFSADDLIDFPEFVESEQLNNESITAYKTRLSLEKKEYDREKKKYMESIKDIARGFQIHRHFGFDIILATQDQSLLNNLAKKCVGEHYHLTRPFGLKGNMIFFWRRLVTNPDSSEAKRNVEWKKHINFKKSYFGLYRSANVHTHTSKIPLKYILMGLFIISICILPFYLLHNNKALALYSGNEKEFIASDKSKDIIINSEMPSDLDISKIEKPQPIIEVELNKQEENLDDRDVSGCVFFNGKYHAFDINGNPILSKSDLCKNAINNNDRSEYKAPLPIQRNIQNNYSDSAQDSLDQQVIENVQSQRDYFNEP